MVEPLAADGLGVLHRIPGPHVPGEHARRVALDVESKRGKAV
jgi:hypothetical protein